MVAEVGGDSAIPIASMAERLIAAAEHFSGAITFHEGNLLDYEFLLNLVRAFQPEAVVHLAEIPSAPYSMIDAAHASLTQSNNVIGNLNLLWAIKEAAPEAHLIKLGTMGEYGTPNVDIPEGFFEIEYRGRKDRLPFPRQAGSFYHLSKVHDSHNTLFACRNWGIRATDIMQGVVYGTQVPHLPDDTRLQTRLDFDQCFGTAINRFVCQVITNHPITVYGGGKQTRSFLPLQDSIRCITLVIENPPQLGDYRVFNQFDQCYSLAQLAATVQHVASTCGLSAQVIHLQNPRREAAEHYYNPDRQRLVALGYQPQGNVEFEVETMIGAILPHRKRIQQRIELLVPDVHWDGKRQRAVALTQAAH